ncbi:PREDICTED: uncharacterized protein LOC105624880 [Atta cephalotes]|uniref:Telomerase ribonucleoprotein complex - RNA-binding domain-containing protein n=1 Tax=Atta cephalotes TaxID=12957 RepID=A0A158NVR3_ATTCE|nr:PREDICTED: uncharacterized protein LOC105624880 [Atta cephalotes]
MIRNCDTLSFTNNYRKRYISCKGRWNKKHRNICLKSKAVTKVTCPIPLQAYNSKMKLFQSRCKLRKGNRTTAKISKYSILESKNTEQDMCHKILSTDIGLTGHYRNVNLDSVIPALSPIMTLFKNRHNKYNYFDKLKCIIDKDRKQYPPLKFKHQIHVHSLQSFFGLLIYENVPLELFGTLKNQKVMKKTISRLLKTIPNKILITSAFKRTARKTVATGASLIVELFFRKLDISKINWLHSVDDATIQWIIILKLLHWFFAQYIIKILHKYVVLIAIRKQWVYITKDDWCNMQNEYIKEKEKSGSLVPYMTSNKKRITGTYKFIPGSSGLRPLYMTNDRDKKEAFRRYYANSATYTLNVTRIMRRSFARYDKQFDTSTEDDFSSDLDLPNPKVTQSYQKLRLACQLSKNEKNDQSNLKLSSTSLHQDPVINSRFTETKLFTGEVDHVAIPQRSISNIESSASYVCLKRYEEAKQYTTDCKGYSTEQQET